MEIVEGVKLLGLFAGALALPVAALSRAVHLSRDVREFHDQAVARDRNIESAAIARMESHERTCAERMSRLDERHTHYQESQLEIKGTLSRIEQQLMRRAH